MNPYKTLIEVGTQRDNLSANEKKKIRMVNIMITLWYHAFILMSIMPLIAGSDFGAQLVLNCFGFLCVASCHLINRSGKQTLSAFLLILYTLFHYLLITCAFATGRYVEFFYLAVPLASLMLFSELIYSWIILALSIIFFHIPFLFFDFYDKEGVLFMPPILIFLFFVIFFGVLYFRRLNTQNENLLAAEKIKAELDKGLIENQHAALEELSRFKNRFFINLSHEIRTPLTLINGGVNKLVTDKAYNEVAVDRIQNNVNAITKLIDDVLDLAKIEEQKLTLRTETVSGNELMNKMHGMFESLFAQKNITIELKLAKADLPVLVDHVYFERSISNLIHNAYKYTADGGQVVLGTQVHGTEMELYVEDNGIGIPAEMLDNIFNHFEQVNNDINSASGSGIGLSFTKQVIEQHQGRITVKSKEGEGSKFSVWLQKSDNPIAALGKDSNAVRSSKAVTEELTGQGELIFIVDDNKDIRDYLVEIFENYQCLTFNNGKEALEAMKNHNPACVISDYMMPVMDGYELIQNMRDIGYKTPSIILTARSDEQNKMDVLRLGVDDYITKPFNEDELLIKVNNLIAQHIERVTYVKEIEDNGIETEEVIPEDQFLTDLNALIVSNIEKKKFEISEIAELLNTSERTLHRKVKSLTGLSPKQYVIALRMQTARVLLEQGKHSTIKEIALSVGFSNQSYFAELYERQFGRRP